MYYLLDNGAWKKCSRALVEQKVRDTYRLYMCPMDEIIKEAA